MQRDRRPSLPLCHRNVDQCLYGGNGTPCSFWSKLAVIKSAELGGEVIIEAEAACETLRPQAWRRIKSAKSGTLKSKYP
jgi:hypothetical protein